MNRWFLFQLVQTKKVENLNLGFLPNFSSSPSILSSCFKSVGPETKCAPAFKAQDWRESVSVLALLELCCMTLSVQGILLFPSKDKAVRPSKVVL